MVGDDKGGDRASLLGIVDGTTDDVGLNGKGGVAPTSPPPLTLKNILIVCEGIMTLLVLILPVGVFQ